MDEATVAHRSLPLGTLIEVRNLRNGRTIDAEVTERGPYVRGRMLDVSKGVAEELDMLDGGTTAPSNPGHPTAQLVHSLASNSTYRAAQRATIAGAALLDLLPPERAVDPLERPAAAARRRSAPRSGQRHHVRVAPHERDPARARGHLHDIPRPAAPRAPSVPAAQCSTVPPGKCPPAAHPA